MKPLEFFSELIAVAKKNWTKKSYKVGRIRFCEKILTFQVPETTKKVLLYLVKFPKTITNCKKTKKFVFKTTQKKFYYANRIRTTWTISLLFCCQLLPCHTHMIFDLEKMANSRQNFHIHKSSFKFEPHQLFLIFRSFIYKLVTNANKVERNVRQYENQLAAILIEGERKGRERMCEMKIKAIFISNSKSSIYCVEKKLKN